MKKQNKKYGILLSIIFTSFLTKATVSTPKTVNFLGVRSELVQYKKALNIQQAQTEIFKALNAKKCDPELGNIFINYTDFLLKKLLFKKREKGLSRDEQIRILIGQSLSL